MPIYTAIDGRRYHLGQENYTAMLRMEETVGAERAAAYAVGTFVMEPREPGQEIRGVVGTTAIVDEWTHEYQTQVDDAGQADPNRPRPDLPRADLTDLELRAAVARIDGQTIFNIPNAWHRLQEENKEMEKLKPLTYPLTPEVNPDGTRRLFKSRYSELESMYSDLHYRHMKSQASHTVRDKMIGDINGKYQAANMELQRVKATFIDGEVVSKRLHQICKEVGIPVPNERLSMQQQMDAFLGSVLSMIRIEGVDELAE